jgi:hypothetical protein
VSHICLCKSGTDFHYTVKILRVVVSEFITAITMNSITFSDVMQCNQVKSH